MNELQNTRSLKIKALVGLVCLSLTGLVFAHTLTQTKKGSEKFLPDGKWSLAFRPYAGDDRGSLPIILNKVMSEGKINGVGVTKVGLYNVSEKPVVAVRFGWLLKTEGNRKSVIGTGATGLLGLSAELLPNHGRTVVYPILSFAHLRKVLPKNDVMNEDYGVEIYVQEVRFADGSMWEKGKSQAGLISRKSSFIQTSFMQCSKQKCKTNVTTAGDGKSQTIYYTCDASDYNEFCSVKSDSKGNPRGCVTQACGYSIGGGSPGLDSGGSNGAGWDDFDDFLENLTTDDYQYGQLQ